MSSLVVIIASQIFLITLFAQSRDNDHWAQKYTRWAHPDPLEHPEYPYLIPLQGEELPTYFTNVNIIIHPENDPVPVQNESSIAINPLNPNICIASAVDYRRSSSTWVYVSTDGGRTWDNKFLGQPFPNWVSSNDPSVAFDAQGRGFLCYGGFDVSNPRTGENGVFIAITTDNGQTWQAHIPVILHTGTQTVDSAFEDKYYITVDNCSTSPHRLNLYIPWKRVIARDSSTQIVLSRSTDHGYSWSSPVAVSERLPGSSEDTTFGQSFPLAATGPDGEVYVVWNHGPEHGIGFAKSTDGGVSFSPPRIIHRYRPLGVARQIPEGIRHTVKGSVRAETYPVLVCDTLPGERNGYLYLCWAADPVPSVYFSRSTDGGQTWSSPITVHSDTTNDQFWPWMSQDPTTGHLAIMYLDSRDDPENILTHIYVSLSTDGGLTWTDRRITDVPSDIRRNPFEGNAFAGDYSGCAFFDGWILPSWVDMRNTILSVLDNDVYTALVNVNAPLPVDTLIVRIIPEEPTKLQLEWPPVSETVFGKPLTSEQIQYVIWKDSQLLATLPGNITSLVDTGLAPYVPVEYRITVVSGDDTSKSVTAIGYPGGARQPLPPMLSLDQWIHQPQNIQISVTLPTKRADRQTPLANLHHLTIYRDSVLIKHISLSPQDTGRTILLRDTVPVEGYYTYFATVGDNMEPPNESQPSNALLLFAGTPKEAMQETFDQQLPKYYNRGWEQSEEFAHSIPYALTESPGEKYPRRAQDTFLLFPIHRQHRNAIALTFWHAAFIHPSDTGFVEISWNSPDRWKPLLKTNRTAFPAWEDGIVSTEDWKKETLMIYPDTDQDSIVFIRFRFSANVIGTDDGWYIDDLLMSPVSQVSANTALQAIRIYPIPTRRWLTIESPEPLSSEITLRDLLGRTLSPQLYQMRLLNPHQFILDGTSLPEGLYILQIGTSQFPFWILRD